MAEQLDHLAELAERPSIDVRVLTLDRNVFVAAFGSFTVLTAHDSTEPYMAYVKDRVGPHYLDRQHEVDSHVELFSYLADVALSPSESLDLISTVREERYR